MNGKSLARIEREVHNRPEVTTGIAGGGGARPDHGRVGLVRLDGTNGSLRNGVDL